MCTFTAEVGMPLWSHHYQQRQLLSFYQYNMWKVIIIVALRYSFDLFRVVIAFLCSRINHLYMYFACFMLKLFLVLLLICRNPLHSENINVYASCVITMQEIFAVKKMNITVYHIEILNSGVRFVFLSLVDSCFMPRNKKLFVYRED